MSDAKERPLKEKDAKIKADTPIHFAVPTKSKSHNTNEFNCFYIFI